MLSALTGVAILASIAAAFSVFSGFQNDHQNHYYLPTATGEKFPILVDSQFSSFPDVRQNTPLTSAGIVVQNGYVFPEKSCELCTHVMQNFSTLPEEAIIYLAPDASYNLEGAKRVTFSAMGFNGGERVRILIGSNYTVQGLDQWNASLGNSQINSLANSFPIRTDYITMTTGWKKYEVDVSNISLTGNSMPFALQASRSSGHDIADFLVKDIIFDSKAASKGLTILHS